MSSNPAVLAASSLTRRLRVVSVYFHTDYGGIETTILEVLPRLDRGLFDTEFVCIRRRGARAGLLREQGIPVRLRRSFNHLPFAYSVRRLGGMLARLNADIVHAHGEIPVQLATAAGRRAGVPILIAHFHTIGLFGAERQLRREREQCGWRDATIHVSESVHRDYVRRVRPPHDDGVVVYNGVNVGFFSDAPPRKRLDELRRTLDIEGRGPVILMVARLHRDKRHRDVLRSLVRLRETHPGVVLLLAGGGRYRSQIVAAVRELGLEDAVRLLGVRTDARDLYHLADLNVLSSVKEGFSSVVLEAMAAGLPQVLTDVGGNAEAVGRSGCALLVPPRDPAALAQAIERVLGDPDHAASMRQAARDHVNRFAVKEQVRRTELVYLDAVRRKSPTAWPGGTPFCALPPEPAPPIAVGEPVRETPLPAAKPVPVLVYQAYGPRFIADQVLYSLATLQAHRGDARIRTVVYTDRPGVFAGLGVEVVPVDATLISRWQGPLRYVHRFKIEMIVDALARFGADVLYLDADTFWRAAPQRVLHDLARGVFLFHESEGRIGQQGRHLWLHRFLRRVRQGELPPLSRPIPADVTMLNAGLLGIPYDRRELLLDALELTDELQLRCYQSEWLEQLAFSYVLASAGPIATAHAEVVHYWPDKVRAEAAVRHLVAEADGSPRLLSREEFERLCYELAPAGESRLAKQRRKLRRSWRKRVSWVRAKRLARQGYHQSAEYRSRLDELRSALSSAPMSGTT